MFTRAKYVSMIIESLLGEGVPLKKAVRRARHAFAIACVRFPEQLVGVSFNSRTTSKQEKWADLAL